MCQCVQGPRRVADAHNNNNPNKQIHLKEVGSGDGDACQRVNPSMHKYPEYAVKCGTEVNPKTQVK